MCMRDEDETLCGFIKLPNCRNNNQLIRWELGSQIHLKMTCLYICNLWNFSIRTQDSSTELLLTKDPTIIVSAEWCKSLWKVLLFPKQTGRSNKYKDILLFLKQSPFLSNFETCGKDSVPMWFVWSLGGGVTLDPLGLIKQKQPQNTTQSGALNQIRAAGF